MPASLPCPAAWCIRHVLGIRPLDIGCDFLTLQAVRDFQQRHDAVIYIGEFSAIIWAEGAERYLADCIAIFEEYGWHWSYHAFREWDGWSVEHAWTGHGRKTAPSADNPRKHALLNGFRHNTPQQ